MGPVKVLFVVVIPIILSLISYAAYNYSKEKDLFREVPTPKMTYELYHINKTEHWKDRFAFLESKDYNSIKRTIVGSRQNYLEVRRGYETYLIEYDAQVDTELITQVRQVRQASDKFNYGGRYFLVQYDKFVEIVYFNTSISSTPLSNEVQNGTYEAEICLELPIGVSNNVRYHIDESNNIWIVTASMNKVIFIQIYSCKQKRLVKEYRHVLKDEQYVNEIVKVVKKNKECLVVEAVTYNLNIVELQVCPYNLQRSIKESEPRRSHEIVFQQVEETNFEIFQGYTSNIFSEQAQKIYKYIISFLTFSPNSTVLYDRKPSLDENKKEQFDVIGVDSRNNYLINFSKKTKYTGIMSLNKYLIPAKTPLFHNNPIYNKYDALKILDKEYKKEYVPEVEHKYIVPGLNETKKVTYKAAYQIYPDYKVEHLGLTSSVVLFWPQQKLDDKDYTLIRTHEGGLVSEGSKFKGSFDKLPTLYEEVYQRVDAKAQQVTPAIFEVHMGYVNLMTYLIRSKENQQFIRVQLINMLGGKPILTHYINVKEGYRYISTTLLNNQWWILQYSQKSKNSFATKYELYANASSPSQVLSIKRQYGIIGSQQHLNGEDDLAQLMSEFITKYNNGFILLNVYRCIDQYYYVEYTDSAGKGFGVARIHFKNFSNRRVKKNKKYSGNFEKLLLLEERQMIPEKYSRKPYSVYLEKVDVFEHIPLFLSKNRPNQTWYDFCDSSSGINFKRMEKLGGFYYFPITHYGTGIYGCDFNSDSPYSEKIFVFNMRNLIIDGKVQKEGRLSIRKSIIIWIYQFVVGYFCLVALWLIVKAFVDKGKKSEDKQTSESKSKGKNKKDKEN